jgi:DNA-directed RNA polymerase specialized sigma subunit
MPLTPEQKKQMHEQFVSEHWNHLNKIARSFYHSKIKPNKPNADPEEEHGNLMNIATSSLMEAAHRFDPSKAMRTDDPNDNPFISFLNQTARKNMQTYFSKQAQMPAEGRAALKEAGKNIASEQAGEVRHGSAEDIERLNREYQQKQSNNTPAFGVSPAKASQPSPKEDLTDFFDGDEELTGLLDKD